MVFMLKHRTLVCNHSSDFGFSFFFFWFIIIIFFSMTLVGRGAPFPQQNADLKTGEVRALCVCLCDFSLPFRSQSNQVFFYLSIFTFSVNLCTRPNQIWTRHSDQLHQSPAQQRSTTITSERYWRSESSVPLFLPFSNSFLISLILIVETKNLHSLESQW